MGSQCRSLHLLHLRPEKGWIGQQEVYSRICKCFRSLTISRVLSIVTSVHIALATAHIAVSLAYLVHGFVQLPPGDSLVYYALPSASVHIAQLWVYFFTVYRTLPFPVTLTNC